MEKGNAKTRARQERDKELTRMFNDVLGEMMSAGVNNPWLSALRFTLEHGAPRYHVSFERAYRVVCDLLREGTTSLREGYQLAMWREVTERVKSLMESSGCSIARAVDVVLRECRASRFFISEAYARRHIYRARHERRNLVVSRS